MSYELIMILLCLILWVYFDFKSNKLKDKSHQYLIKYLSQPNDATSRSEFMDQLSEQFNKEVIAIYQKEVDDLTNEELLDLFSKIYTQKSRAALENRNFHKNSLTIIYYNLFLKIVKREIMNENEIKEFELQILKETFSQSEISKLI